MALAIEEDEQKRDEEADAVFTSTSDICDQLLQRYSKSSAAHHRHLCATAAAIRSILQSDSLPLIPPAYFAAAMSALSSSAVDSTSAPHLLYFLSLAVSLAPPTSISFSNAAEAISVLLNLSRKHDNGVFASVLAERALIRCLGFLLGFCNLEDWSAIQPGLETLVSYSVDTRPKIRKNAQIFLEKTFQSFQGHYVIDEASQLVLYLLENHSFLAHEMNDLKTLDDSNIGSVAVFHTLNLLRLTVPYLSSNVRRKVFSEVCSLVTSDFSVTTRHVFNVMESCFGNSIAGNISKEAEKIVVSLASYISVEGNPKDTVVSAMTLLKCAFDALCVHESDTCFTKIPLVFGSLAALLCSEATVATHASEILKVLISKYVNGKIVPKNEIQLCQEEVKWCVDLSAVKYICRVFEDTLASSEHPSDHILIVISHLFARVGASSFSIMRSIVYKLAEFVTTADRDVLSSNHFKACIGSAVISMGPKKMFTLLPLSFCPEKNTCSNFWLVPIVKEFVVRSSLGYFFEHIVPLAESIKKASKRAKKPKLKTDLLAYSTDLLGLLPAFCRNPRDFVESAPLLTTYFVSSLRKSSLRETAVISIQELVQCSTNILKPCGANGQSNSEDAIFTTPDHRDARFYSKKAARKNMRILASISKDLLHSLSELLFKLPSENHQNVKEAIRCLASVSDPEVTRDLLRKYLKRAGIFENFTSDDVEKNSGDRSDVKKAKIWSVITRLAYCIVLEGADKDLVELVYNLIISALKVSDDDGRIQACNALAKIIEVHPWFCSSRYEELVDLVLSLKPGTDIPLVESQFSALCILLIHGIKATSDRENTKAVLVLNEVIFALEHHNKDVRKTACDLLVRVSSLPGCPQSSASHPLQTKLVTMIMGHLSGTTSKIKRGAISALSVMLFKNKSLCVLVPDLVRSVSFLLETKAVDVVKVGLGFMKVLALALEGKELQPFLPQVVPSVLLWSSVSRHHFRSKVSVIMEIVLRKCGAKAVKSITPDTYMDFVLKVLQNRQSRGQTAKSGPKIGLGDSDLGMKVTPSEEPKGGQKSKKNTYSSNKRGPWPGRSVGSGAPGAGRGRGYFGKRKMDQPTDRRNGRKGMGLGRSEGKIGNKKQRMS